jgi:hypothetical protein
MFTKKPIAEPRESQVWIRQAYDRSAKKYEIVRWDDICDVQLMDGDKEVFVDFVF